MERSTGVSEHALRSARSRLIVPLDFNKAKEAIELVEELGPSISFYKVGYEMLLAEGPVFWQELISRYKKHLFYDAKINDIGETVERAIRAVMPMLVKSKNVELLTVNGNQSTIEAAVRGRGELQAGKPKILHVSFLSSLDETDLKEIYGKSGSLTEHVCTVASNAIKAGADGVIASGESVMSLRAHLGTKPLIVVPGVRPSGASTDDHKRTLTPSKAIAYGATYLVVGRPIKNAANPAQAADMIVAEMAEAISLSSQN